MNFGFFRLSIPFGGDKVLRCLAAMLIMNLAIGVVLGGLLLARGYSFAYAWSHTTLGQPALISMRAWVDSWWPMFTAYEYHQSKPAANLYDVFDQGVKFQYPPSALLLCDLLPRSMIAVHGRELDATFLDWLTISSRLETLAIILISAALAVIGRRRLATEHQPQPVLDIATFLSAVLLGVWFAPLYSGHQLGQIQVLLNAGVALALLMYVCGWKGAAGALIGACALIKPQYGIVLIWSLWRGERRFSIGFGVLLSLGLGLALYRFGWLDHWHYVEVLSFISRHGESLYINQSVNGVLNRWLENGAAYVPANTFQSDFAPYHPVVHWVTTLTSVGILCLAFEPWIAKRPSAGIVDLMIVLAAGTIASPVAWDHHYGLFLPIFAITLPLCLAFRPLGPATLPLLAFSFAAMSQLLHHPEWFFANPWRGLMGSHLFFGALVLFGLLLRLRTSGARDLVPLPPGAPLDVPAPVHA